MPIFEFACRQCGHRFEELIRGTPSAECPSCGSDDPEKLLSATAAHVSGSSGKLPVTSACPPADAPPCGPGCCRLP